jgi:hypothetical protein
MTADQLALYLANMTLGSFVCGWISCYFFMRWRDRRRPPPF